jgi:Predicted DNA-binding protein with PD1-like DNA-binding motif
MRSCSARWVRCANWSTTCPPAPDRLPDDRFITVEGNGPIELGSLSGNVIDGDPHLHIVAQDAKGTYVGHLEEGTEVLFLAEIILAEIKDPGIHRVKNEHGVVYLDRKPQ